MSFFSFFFLSRSVPRRPPNVFCGGPPPKKKNKPTTYPRLVVDLRPEQHQQRVRREEQQPGGVEHCLCHGRRRPRLQPGVHREAPRPEEAHGGVERVEDLLSGPAELRDAGVDAIELDGRDGAEERVGCGEEGERRGTAAGFAGGRRGRRRRRLRGGGSRRLGLSFPPGDEREGHLLLLSHCDLVEGCRRRGERKREEENKRRRCRRREGGLSAQHLERLKRFLLPLLLRGKSLLLFVF